MKITLPAERLLGELSESELATLGAKLRWQSHLPGSVVLRQGRQDSTVRFVASGSLRVSSISPTGREVILRTLLRGDCIGDFAAIDGLAAGAQVVALEQCWLGSMPASEFVQWLTGAPERSLAHTRMLIGVVRSMARRVVELSTLTANMRIRSEILRLARQHGPDDNRGRIDPAPPHREIAARADTQREVVTRELGRLVELGLIHWDQDALLIPDLGALDRAASAIADDVM